MDGRYEPKRATAERDVCAKSESKDQRAFRRARDLCEPIRRGHLKLHPQAPGTQIPTEMLAKQRLDVGLVVDHQSQDAQL